MAFGAIPEKRNRSLPSSRGSGCSQYPAMMPATCVPCPFGSSTRHRSGKLSRLARPERKAVPSLRSPIAVRWCDVSYRDRGNADDRRSHPGVDNRPCLDPSRDSHRSPGEPGWCRSSGRSMRHLTAFFQIFGFSLTAAAPSPDLLARASRKRSSSKRVKATATYPRSSSIEGTCATWASGKSFRYSWRVMAIWSTTARRITSNEVCDSSSVS